MDTEPFYTLHVSQVMCFTVSLMIGRQHFFKSCDLPTLPLALTSQL